LCFYLELNVYIHEDVPGVTFVICKCLWCYTIFMVTPLTVTPQKTGKYFQDKRNIISSWLCFICISCEEYQIYVLYIFTFCSILANRSSEKYTTYIQFIYYSNHTYLLKQKYRLIVVFLSWIKCLHSWRCPWCYFCHLWCYLLSMVLPHVNSRARLYTVY
jgi:hypothetical protein